MRRADSTTRFFMPLGVKLILIVSLILLLSLGGITVMTTAFFGLDIERSSKLATVDKAEVLAKSAETLLAGYRDSARLAVGSMDGSISTNPGLAQALLSRSRISEVLLVTGNANSRLIKYEIASSAGRGSAGSVRPDLEKMISTHEVSIVRGFSGHEELINLSGAYGKNVLGLISPYGGTSSQNVTSILLILFPGEELSSALMSRELYSNFMTDRNGLVLCHPDPSMVLQSRSMADNELVRDNMRESGDIRQTGFKGLDGMSYLGSYVRVLSGSASVYSVVALDTAMEGVYLLQKRNFFLVMIVLCVSFLVIYLFSKSITVPIKTVVQGTRQVAAGNFSDIPPVRSHDEIGELSIAFNEMSRGLLEREKIKAAFGKFVNKDIAERALRDELTLGGTSREAAVFFSDIRSFTAISERLTPHEVVAFLNEYMTRMVSCVNATNGLVDKFIGDAVMAVWGVPESHGNDTENAINCALLMRYALLEYNSDRGSEKKPVIRIGCGINTGEVIAGQIGSPERMEYTVIGDSVNLASRLESLNKPFGTDILISEHSSKLVENTFSLVAMNKVMVKGKTEPQNVYAVLGRLDDARRPANLSALRILLGIRMYAPEQNDSDGAEKKYEILV